MISIIETGALLNPDMTPMNAASATLVGLSTDIPKPTNAGNGWIFSEIDTGKIYIYDAENSTWREWSGGSGGGGSSDTVILQLNPDTWAFDKTWNEIKTALAGGKRVIYPFEDDEDGVYGQMNVVQLSQADGDYVVHFAQVFEDNMVVSTAHCTGADEYPAFD